MIMDILGRAEIDDRIGGKTNPPMAGKKLDKPEACNGRQKGVLVSQGERSSGFTLHDHTRK